MDAVDVKSVDMWRITSTFRRVAIPIPELKAIELYKFVNFPLSIVVILTNGHSSIENSEIECVLPLLLVPGSEAQLALELPEKVFLTIQKTCLERDGQKTVECNNGTSNYEVRFSEQAIVRKPFYVVVYDTKDNKVLARADISHPTKSMKKLTKMLVESIPTVRLSFTQSLRKMMGYNRTEQRVNLVVEKPVERKDTEECNDTLEHEKHDALPQDNGVEEPAKLSEMVESVNNDEGIVSKKEDTVEEAQDGEPGDRMAENGSFATADIKRRLSDETVVDGSTEADSSNESPSLEETEGNFLHSSTISPEISRKT